MHVVGTNMTITPWLSVIIPAFNSERYLSTCIDSVLAQTMRDFEVICIDDGSFDSTPQILESYVARDERVRFIKQNNASAGVARNAGLEVARGEFIYCLDADDYVQPTLFASSKKVLQDTGADMALLSFRTYNDQLQRSFTADWSIRNEDIFPSHPHGVFSGQTNPDLFFETVQNVPWNKIVRRSLLGEERIRFQPIRLTEDLMYSIPAAIKAKSIVRIPQPLVGHREFTGTNLMANKGSRPLDFLDAFAALKAWLQSEGVYDQFRLAFQTWLLDAVYYNMPTYRNLVNFNLTYERLTANNLEAFDLAEIVPEQVRDHRHRALLVALQSTPREQFLLVCANILAAEVQEQKCGFQERQTSTKWLMECLRERFIARN